MRRRTRVVVFVATGLTALAVAGLVGGAVVMGERLETAIQRVPEPFSALPSRPPQVAAPDDEPERPDPVNILILGSDSRASRGDPGQWALGAQRTDTIMLVHIPSDRSAAIVISFPRDSWVTIPDHGEAKINAAYSWGGFPLLIETIEGRTGIRIDHVALADFQSFVALTDAVGGVEITVPENTYESGNLVVDAGTHLMDGEQALAYARQRYGLPGGDFDRIKRQQNWLRAIMIGFARTDLLSSPSLVTQTVRTLRDHVAVDPGFGVMEMTTLALSMRDLRPADVTFLTVPVEGTGWSPDGKQSIVILDDPALDALSEAVAGDDASAYLKAHDELPILGEVVR